LSESTQAHVEDAFAKFKNYKAPGEDGITVEMFKNERRVFYQEVS
jgi:hypothetical protein